MYSYLLRVRSFSPDVKLVLVYCLLAGIGYGVIELIFNFYLLELGYKEDFIGGVAGDIDAGSGWRVVVPRVRHQQVRNLVDYVSAGFSLLSASCIGMSLATATWVLLPLAVGYGASLSYLTNPVLPFIMDHERPDQRQHATAVSLSVFSLSIMIGSLMGGLTPNFFARIVPSISAGSVGAYRAAMLTGAVVALLAMIPLFLMKEPRKFKTNRRSRSNLTDELPPSASRRVWISRIRADGRPYEYRRGYDLAVLQRLPQKPGIVRRPDWLYLRDQWAGRRDCGFGGAGRGGAQGRVEFRPFPAFERGAVFSAVDLYAIGRSGRARILLAVGNRQHRLADRGDLYQRNPSATGAGRDLWRAVVRLESRLRGGYVCRRHPDRALWLQPGTGGFRDLQRSFRR